MPAAHLSGEQDDGGGHEPKRIMYYIETFARIRDHRLVSIKINGNPIEIYSSDSIY